MSSEQNLFKGCENNEGKFKWEAHAFLATRDKEQFEVGPYRAHAPHSTPISCIFKE